MSPIWECESRKGDHRSGILTEYTNTQKVVIREPRVCTLCINSEVRIRGQIKNGKPDGLRQFGSRIGV